MGSKKEKQNPPEESSEEEEEEEQEVEEDVEEEEEEEEEVEEKETHQEKPQPSSSSGTEGSDEDNDDDHSTSHPIQTSVKRQPTPPPETVPNSEDDGTESGDEEADLASDSPRSATDSAYTVKPITTVPVNSKVSKPTAKRPLESSKNDAKGSTDRKKVKTGEESDKKGKGGVFPGRLWSEESEIVILQGILNYQREKGPFRSADTGVFYEFIKGELWDGVTKTQIGDKIKRLKTKYGKNVKNGENDQDPIFPKAHDKKAFELSKQIWGVGSASVSNGKEKKAKTKVVDIGKGGKKLINSGSETKRVVEDSSKVKVKSDDPKGKKVSNDGSPLMDVDVDVNEDAKRDLVKKGDVEGDFLSKFPTLSKSLDAETVSLKDFLHLIGSQNASELEEEWKLLQLEEMNVAAKRVILKGKQTKLVLDAMKKQ